MDITSRSSRRWTSPCAGDEDGGDGSERLGEVDPLRPYDGERRTRERRDTCHARYEGGDSRAGDTAREDGTHRARFLRLVFR